MLAGNDGGCLPAGMRDDHDARLLQGVSRSFYLSLRLLPRPMRGAAGLGYLLARTSDTLADSAAIEPGARVDALDAFERALEGGSRPIVWPQALQAAVADPMERRLLEHTADLIRALDALPAGEAALVREVVGIIVGGQRLDLLRFGRAGAADPVALADDAELDDYTWRVAGCVGAFWTKLGFLTLGPGFASDPEPVMIERGIAYGKSLQLVNILRDLPRDLADGRCYLPVRDPRDRDEILACHAVWLGRARDPLGQGFAYAAALPERRLRAASLLPAQIARETLDRLATADWDGLCRRVKIPRRRVYLALFRALVGKPGAIT